MEWYMSRFLSLGPVEWWRGKKTSVIGVRVFLYMVCQVVKSHALLLEWVWGEFCNILICTLECVISLKKIPIPFMI